VDDRYRPFSYLGGLSSNMSAEINDEIEMVYAWIERANLL
jgi:hypothetical protein